MLASTTPSSTSTTKPSKSLSTSINRDEAKSPETETVEQSKPVEQKKVKPTTSTPKKSTKSVSKSSPSSNRKVSPLSSRALKVKQNLNKKEEVCAVLLKPDGFAEEIKYNTSSKQANKILNGRPTIIGELEGIQVIIVRSLNQTNCGSLNKHILPVPFCNKQYNGNYLLYRVDSKGNPINLSLKQYEQYVADNKTLTEQARKNYDPVDNQEIKAHSSFSSNSRLTLVYLRSEVDKKIREEFKQKNGRNPTESEIEESVNVSLQKLVNELVSTSSPMNDPDYNPNDEDGEDDDIKGDDDDVINRIREIYRDENGVDINNGDLAKTLSNTQRLLEKNNDIIGNVDIMDDRDWRLQLNDALNYVRERGRLDGRVLAEKISETFYELNGIEPTLDQLIDVFRRIKAELAEEAQQDILDENNDDNGTAYYLAQKLGPDFNNADPSDLVDYAFRIVREDLVFRAKSSFQISKGREPNKFELKETVEKLALKLANEALKFNVNNRVNIECEDDPDYNPNNAVDRKLEVEDELETEQFNEDYFNLRMLSTPRTKSKTGVAETYDVYFCKFSEKREKRNLLAAIDSFKMRNKREPTKLEINRLKQFLSTSKDTSLVQFKLSVVSDSDENDEVNDDDDKEEEKNEILLVNESKKLQKQQTTPSKVLVTPVKNKKSAARYSVYFEDDKVDERRNEKMAIKWFKRFNNREPTKLELVGINQFIKADKSELIECEFNVPIDDETINDDVKQTEEDDIIRSNKMKMKTDYVVKKKLSTKYTLNFDDEEERENGNEKQAIKWFKRFNNRNPTNHEIEKIKSFVKADNDDTIDID